MDSVHIRKFDMCAYGMTVETEDGTMPAHKRTAIMTNSPEAARRLSKQCSNGTPGATTHVHAKLEGGKRCKQAQVYPREFCRAVCDAIVAQKLADLMNVVSLDVMRLEEINAIGGDELHEPEGSTKEYTATDDVT